MNKESVTTENATRVDVNAIGFWYAQGILLKELDNIFKPSKIETAEECLKAIDELNRIKNAVLESDTPTSNMVCIADDINEEIKLVRKRLSVIEGKNDEMKCIDWFPIGSPFIAELEFDVANEDTAYQIIKSYMKDTYILPNLRVKAFYARNCTVDSIITKENVEKLEELRMKWKKILESFSYELEDFIETAGYKKIDATC